MSEHRNVIGMVIERMPATVSGLMFTVLAFPVTVALGCFILQLNAGAVITSYLDIKLAEAAREAEAPVVVIPDDYEEMKAWICQHKQIGQPGFCK